MPLLRRDAGSLYDSFIGHSERNLREALATAAALALSVLWIDEIEKGFGSTGPSESDGGLGYRMLGALATWMQERTDPVFLIATSNDITKLPPELTRQGRFDEVFLTPSPHGRRASPAPRSSSRWPTRRTPHSPRATSSAPQTSPANSRPRARSASSRQTR
jgi:SpoVK/Ycf46/Vps4 family AAA+-type ATPase